MFKQRESICKPRLESCVASAAAKVIVPLLAASLLAVTPAFGAFVSYKLNAPLADGGDVRWFRISPDGKWVVYVAEQDTPGAAELYSVPIQGGTSVRLNTVLPSGVEIYRFQITADSQRVVYNAPQDSAGVWELYSVPIEGPASEAIKLNPPLTSGGDVGNGDLADIVFYVSPDGKRVVYHADQDTDNVLELYSVPVDGPATATIKLNPPLPPDGDVNWSNGPFLAISADSQRVVYLADQDTEHLPELYSVPITGPANDAVKLNGTIVADGDITYYQISPDGSRVIYLADQLQNFKIEVFSVPIEGPAGAGVKLSQTLPAGGFIYDFEISPDSQRVVYRGEQDTNDVAELYSVPIEGPASAGMRLNAPLVSGQDVESYIKITADSQRVIYVADEDTDDVSELYSVAIDGSGLSLKRNPTLVPGGDVDDSEFEISPDGRHVIYVSDQETDERHELYSVPPIARGSGTVKLNTAIGLLGGDVLSAVVAPDSGSVAYRLSRINPVTFDLSVNLYHVPIRGPASASIRVNGPLVSGGEVWYPQYSSDSGYIVYLADAEQDDVIELYAADVRAGAGQWNQYN